MRVHDVFHVSLLKKYVHDPNHVINWDVIQVEPEGELQIEPMHILARKVNNASEPSNRTSEGAMGALRS